MVTKKESEESTIKKLIEWCENQVKENDDLSGEKTGNIASYYLGKASGINEVKLFLTEKK